MDAQVITDWVEQQLRDKLKELQEEMEGLNNLLTSTNSVLADIREKKVELWDKIELIKKELRDKYSATDV